MDPKQIAPEFWVSPQLSVEDVEAAAAQGFRAILCNRPDGEDMGQPSQATIRTAAGARGLAFRAVPVIPGRITDDDVTAFRAALEELPGPVLAYCRSGARAANLWALAGGGARQPGRP